MDFPHNSQYNHYYEMHVIAIQSPAGTTLFIWNVQSSVMPVSSLLFGQGSTLSALSTQAVPAFAFLLAGTACQDKPDEAEPRPNKPAVG
jgi:hypothetical protein